MSKSQKTFGHLIEQISKTELVVLDELKQFIPPLKIEEYRLLENSLLQEGCREPLLAWRNNEQAILIDGHNRYEICKRRQIEYRVKFKEFDSLEEAKAWMIANQLGRRNLTTEQQSYLRGLQYLTQKQNHGGHRESSDQNDHLPTAERLALEHGISAPTIRRDADYSLGIERIGKYFPESKHDILAGKLKLKKNIIRQIGELDSIPETTLLEKSTNLNEWLLNLGFNQVPTQADSTHPPEQLDSQLTSVLQELLQCEDLRQLKYKKKKLLDLLKSYIDWRDSLVRNEIATADSNEVR